MRVPGGPGVHLVRRHDVHECKRPNYIGSQNELKILMAANPGGVSACVFNGGVLTDCLRP